MKLKSKYTTEIEIVERGDGRWDYNVINIFTNDDKGNKTKIGSYQRNYSSFYNTFVPFIQNNKEYALYSRDYQETRVMRLPDCIDIAGDEWKGFCPTDFYVPDPSGLGDTCREGDDDVDENAIYLFGVYNSKDKKLNYDTTNSGKLGFVSGCAWGDDSSWKIQIIDLSEIENGVIKRRDELGYLELPDCIEVGKLGDAVEIVADRDYGDDVSKYPYGMDDVFIVHKTMFNLKD